MRRWRHFACFLSANFRMPDQTFQAAEKRQAEVSALRKENKTCFVCGDKGPQYICSNFATFVCMMCSGLHRQAQLWSCILAYGCGV